MNLTRFIMCVRLKGKCLANCVFPGRGDMMEIGALFEKWGFSGLSINLGVIQTNWKPQLKDKEAAWELYIELLTRITTQALPKNAGDEKVALESIYSLFPTTREILKTKGRVCIGFSKIAIIILNQVVRPFTAKWHKKFIESNSLSEDDSLRFREELNDLQGELCKYCGMLSEIAGVENLVELENKKPQDT